MDSKSYPQGSGTIKGRYISGNLVFVQGPNAPAAQAIHYGKDADSKNFDCKWFGATTGSYLLWDESAETLDLRATGLAAADIGADFRVTVSAPNNQYGMAGYFDATINGTTAGHCYGFGSWINTGATSPVLSAGHIIVPFEGGVYTGEAQTNARVVFGGQHQAILNGAPASLHAWRLNATQTITAIIAAANPGSVGYTAGVGAGTAVGWITIADIVGVGVVYAKVYSAT